MSHCFMCGDHAPADNLCDPCLASFEIRDRLEAQATTTHPTLFQEPR